jgi:hypothetical protein
MCETGTLRGMPANLVPRTVGSVPNTRTFGNCVGKLSLRGQPIVCLGYLARFKSIDFRPLTLSETA